MTTVFSATASNEGLTVKAYTGDRCVLLAFNLDAHLTDRLAGFAIRRTPASTQQWTWLGNRLNFQGAYVDPAVSKDGKFFPSNDAPFQKFWWTDFPPGGTAGSFTYEVIVKRFKDPATTDLVDDQKVDVTINVGPFKSGDIEVAFTRGYLSSQAYSDKFHNAPFQPKGKHDWDFDTGPFREEWAWLGGHARQAIIEFLNDCHTDKQCSLDAFVYDLNEPDIITALEIISSEGRLRMLADNNNALHGPGTDADQAFKKIQATAPASASSGFAQGHFTRYQHNKVLIKRDSNGKAVRVLTGSTNFSITGLYVNANHALIFDSAEVASLYGEAFDAAMTGELKSPSFEAKEISSKEFPVNNPGLPSLRFSFAPHKKPTFSLDTLANALNGAQSSVIFAVMELGGGGRVLEILSKLHENKDIFSYGISDRVDSNDDTIDGTKVYSKDRPGELVYSKSDPEKFPPPFNAELQVHGAKAHIIHHKFVVVDFNGENPVVFGGSSNLAEGGEESNGDNLFAIYDRAIATAFAIEGIRLVDHYAFAAALKKSQTTGETPAPLALKTDEGQWYKVYYDENNIRNRERLLFSR